MPELNTDNWVRVGWQGLTFTIPEDWNIGAIGGEKTQGYLRFDDADMPRLEVKWADAGTTFVDLDKVVEKYLREMSKGRKNQTEVNRDIKLTSKRKLRGKKAPKFFAWKGETQGFGAAWFCPDCHKTVIVQVMGRLTEPVQEMAEQVVVDLEDHPRDEWILWSAYGFDFYSPRDFTLATQKLMAGLIEIGLARDTEQLLAARWGMANVILRKQSLQEWGKKELAKRIKRFDTEFSETTHRGHEAVTIAGRTALPQEKLKSFVDHVRGKGFPDRVQALLWHCPESNKLFYVEGVLDRENVHLVQDVADRIECH
ncbi:MAG: hypothetical protein KKI08_13730 [Armatimonadetes bacterium]|nr:hypothetical protein [Armatimonadota bacterium]